MPQTSPRIASVGFSFWGGNDRDSPVLVSEEDDGQHTAFVFETFWNPDRVSVTIVKELKKKAVYHLPDTHNRRKTIL